MRQLITDTNAKARVGNLARNRTTGIWPCILITIVMQLATTAVAEDVVVLKPKEGRGTIRSSGEIIDFNGKQLILRRAGNREEIIDSRRVVDVETTFTSEHLAADELFDHREFEKAAATYQTALRAEKRSWVQRRIVAQIVWCHRNTGQLERALNSFLQLSQVDSTIQFFNAMPVLWSPEPLASPLEKRARQLLTDQTASAPAKLIGASWLLPTAHRGDALNALQDLATAEDARIVFWAEAQLWRTQLVSASLEKVTRWQDRFSRMPSEIQGGPAFVLGQAFSRHKKHAEAALFFMRVPILHPLDRGHAAHALLAAGRELETMNRPVEAMTIYREIAADYGSSSAAGIAQGRLNELNK